MIRIDTPRGSISDDAPAGHGKFFALEVFVSPSIETRTPHAFAVSHARTGYRFSGPSRAISKRPV